MSDQRNKYSSTPLYGLRKQRAAASSGGGFQIQKQPRGRNMHTTLQMLMSLALPALLLIAFIFNSTYLFWAFAVASLLCVVWMWLRSAFVRNARATLTLIYAALIMVSGVAIWINTPIEDTTQATPPPSNVDVFSSEPSYSLLDQAQNQGATVVPTEDPNAVSAAQMQLIRFMDYWAVPDNAGMLSICLPTWVAQQENPDKSIFQLRANRTPVEYNIESVTGSDVDSSRTVNMTVRIDKNNSKEPSLYRFQVLMLRINDTWYVDPRSLGGTLVVETASTTGDASAAAQTAATEPPSTPATTAPTFILYYNKEGGGKYYHADPNCKSMNSKWLPLKTSFYYRDVNSDTYKNLLPCGECDAPKR